MFVAFIKIILLILFYSSKYKKNNKLLKKKSVFSFFISLRKSNREKKKKKSITEILETFDPDKLPENYETLIEKEKDYLEIVEHYSTISQRLKELFL